MLSSHLNDKKGVYLLAIDETVEDKAGKSTSKIGYFFSSKLGKVIKSISVGCLSLIAVETRSSYVVDFEQMEQDVLKSAANKAKKVSKAKAKKDKVGGLETVAKPSGRPLGSKNKAAEKVESESYRVLALLLKRVLPFLAGILIHPSYLVGDGAYGNMTGCLIASENNLSLISKLHYNTVLHYPPSAGSKARIYGEKVDFGQLDRHKFDEKEEDNCIFTFFQIKKVRTRGIKRFVNVVIIRCYNKLKNKTGFVLLFSTDLDIDGMTLVNYYSLRFQIEFNFRDAKQHFGLSDFKNIKPRQVTNAIGMSFFMVNLSTILIQSAKERYHFDFLSILDLKTCFRAILFSNRLNNTPVLNVTNILEPDNVKILANLGAVNIFKSININK
jgi:putative transposase